MLRHDAQGGPLKCFERWTCCSFSKGSAISVRGQGKATLFRLRLRNLRERRAPCAVAINFKICKSSSPARNRRSTSALQDARLIWGCFAFSSYPGPPRGKKGASANRLQRARCQPQGGSAAAGHPKMSKVWPHILVCESNNPEAGSAYCSCAAENSSAANMVTTCSALQVQQQRRLATMFSARKHAQFRQTSMGPTPRCPPACAWRLRAER